MPISKQEIKKFMIFNFKSRIHWREPKAVQKAIWRFPGEKRAFRFIACFFGAIGIIFICMGYHLLGEVLVAYPSHLLWIITLGLAASVGFLSYGGLILLRHIGLCDVYVYEGSIAGFPVQRIKSCEIAALEIDHKSYPVLVLYLHTGRRIIGIDEKVLPQLPEILTKLNLTCQNNPQKILSQDVLA